MTLKSSIGYGCKFESFQLPLLVERLIHAEKMIDMIKCRIGSIWPDDDSEELKDALTIVLAFWETEVVDINMELKRRREVS